MACSNTSLTNSSQQGGPKKLIRSSTRILIPAGTRKPLSSISNLNLNESSTVVEKNKKEFIAVIQNKNILSQEENLELADLKKFLLNKVPFEVSNGSQNTMKFLFSRDAKRNQVVIALGYSGSGKTSTLVGLKEDSCLSKFIQINKNDDIKIQVAELLFQKNDTFEMADKCFEINHKKRRILSNAELRQYRKELEQIEYSENLMQKIKNTLFTEKTINNLASSRSCTIYFVTAVNLRKEMKRLFLIDLPGYENIPNSDSSKLIKSFLSSLTTGLQNASASSTSKICTIVADLISISHFIDVIITSEKKPQKPLSSCAQPIAMLVLSIYNRTCLKPANPRLTILTVERTKSPSFKIYQDSVDKTANKKKIKQSTCRCMSIEMLHNETARRVQVGAGTSILTSIEEANLSKPQKSHVSNHSLMIEPSFPPDLIFLMKEKINDSMPTMNVDTNSKLSERDSLKNASILEDTETETPENENKLQEIAESSAGKNLTPKAKKKKNKKSGSLDESLVLVEADDEKSATKRSHEKEVGDDKNNKKQCIEENDEVVPAKSSIKSLKKSLNTSVNVSPLKSSEPEEKENKNKTKAKLTTESPKKQPPTQPLQASRKSFNGSVRLTPQKSPEKKNQQTDDDPTIEEIPRLSSPSSEESEDMDSSSFNRTKKLCKSRIVNLRKIDDVTSSDVDTPRSDKLKKSKSSFLPTIERDTTEIDTPRPVFDTSSGADTPRPLLSKKSKKSLDSSATELESSENDTPKTAVRMSLDSSKKTPKSTPKSKEATLKSDEAKKKKNEVKGGHAVNNSRIQLVPCKRSNIISILNGTCRRSFAGYPVGHYVLLYSTILIGFFVESVDNLRSFVNPNIEDLINQLPGNRKEKKIELFLQRHIPHGYYCLLCQNCRGVKRQSSVSKHVRIVHGTFHDINRIRTLRVLENDGKSYLSIV